MRDTTDEALQLIDSVLDGKVEEVDLELLITPASASSYLIDKGYEEDDMSTNGWQWDFWQYFTKDDKGFCLSGSGFYGHLKFWKGNKGS